MDLIVRRFARPLLALAVAGAILGLAPFAAALQVHHELAAADHDGHQHSDTDLCQWVQHHTAGSLSAEVPAVACLLPPAAVASPPAAIHRAVDPARPSAPRAPPLV